MTVMLVWLLIWLTCGLVVFYFLFFTQELVGQKIYFYTFLAFWTYFLYKVSRVLIWRKFGIEFIKIDEDRFSIKKSIWGYGKARVFMTNNLKKIKLAPLEEKSFSKVFNDSFWIVGQGTIIVNALDKEYNFGSQISKEDGTNIIKVLNSKIQKIKSAS
tara:strand:- start:103 stop:576 length:474 start_codon:yes stop_codon:yes gene_type:complete